MLKIGVLVSGGGTNLQAIIDSIEQGKLSAQIVSVVSSSVKAFALKRAERHGIPAYLYRKKDFNNNSDYEKALITHFNEKGAELIVMAGFMVILENEFINAFENRIINIHPSLIPSFCGEGFYGLNVHEAALDKGVKVTGATVHFVTNETDAGPIILQKAVDVLDNDTPEVLQRRVMEEAEWAILPEAIRLFAENRLVIDKNKVRRL